MTSETRTAETKPAAELRGIAKLRAHKESLAGDETFPLPDSGVVVTLPKFKPNAIWMKAQQMAEGDQARAQMIYVTQLCMFDGERLTLNDYRELISGPDHLEIVSRVYDGAKDRNKDDSGK